jgi:hypothetical protein
MPMSSRLLRSLRRWRVLYRRGHRCGSLLDSPTAELSERERPLKPLMEWVLRGRSPGGLTPRRPPTPRTSCWRSWRCSCMRLARTSRSHRRWAGSRG